MAENKIANELSDNELVKIVRKEDQERYSEIVERYQSRLFVYIYRLIGNKEEAEDLLQDVFVKVYKNLNSYDTGRKFSSWIYRIAHNETVNYIKRKSLKRFISFDAITSTKDKLDTSSEEEGADKAWLRKEVSKEVSDAMKKLPFKYNQVLTLRYYSDQSYEEIAEILGKPVNTVGTLINRAKKKLSDELKQLNLNK
jgi:RNA polymerase sigma-70 factor, ECF subfamily